LQSSPQTWREGRLFAALAGGVLVSRLPFLGGGYGTDPDAWRVGDVARRMASSHTYIPSRLPGNPVQEIGSALLSGGGPLALNGATAVMSAAAAGFLALSLKRLDRPNALLVGLAFAFTPVVYVNSVAAMDYLWAIAFLMASLYFTLRRQVAAAGVLAGLAVGCRLTSCLMLAPFALHLLLEQGAPLRARIRRVLVLGALGAAVGLLCYVPVLRQYGLRALHHEANHPGAAEALKAATIDTWGPLGVIALGAAILWAAIARLRPRAGEGAPAPEIRALMPWMLAVALYLALFAALPNEAGYLIPVVPFALLLLDARLPRRAFAARAIALGAASFLFGIGRQATPGGPTASPLAVEVNVHGRALVLDPLRGPVPAADSARREAVKYVTRMLARAETLPGNNVVVVGYWWPQVEALRPPAPSEHLRYVERADGDSAQMFIHEGRTIYYLARQDAYNLYTGGVDLNGLGAKELLVDPSGE
jgi:hypothetical protein